MHGLCSPTLLDTFPGRMAWNDPQKGTKSVEAWLTMSAKEADALRIKKTTQKRMEHIVFV